MEKNKRVIILLSVLILGIGVSLAYFVGKTVFSGSGATTEGRTATVNGSTLDVNGTIIFNDIDIYPGHKKVSKIEVTATGENEFIAYNLIWEGNNGLNTNLKYTVYKTKEDIEVDATCEKKKKVRNGIQYLNEECNITNIDQLGEMISEGEITKTEGETPTKEIITNNQYITSKEEPGEKEYYYVIVEYPDNGDNQNEDIGHNFNGRVYAEISNKSADINILGIYIKDEDTGEYKEAQQMPDSAYVINTKETQCTNEAIPTWENSKLIISNLSLDGTECYLYYDKVTKASDVIFTNTNYIEEAPKILGVTACDNGTNTGESGNNCKSTDRGLYKGTDDDGETYYFRGSVTDNWVKFADFYWRIIRINGDGTIRLIYSGKVGEEQYLTFPNNNKINPIYVTGAGTLIDNSGSTAKKYKFNSVYSDNKYVGLMYGNPKNSGYSSTYANAHTNETNSDILDVLNSWYVKNLSKYSEYIDDNAGFCGDRTPYDGDSITSNVNYTNYGFGTVETYYGSYHRLWLSNEEERKPTFKCIKDNVTKTSLPNDNDLYTITDANKGNKKLINSLGLISADEVAYAGGAVGTNKGYWLYTGISYWTISPAVFYTGNPKHAAIIIVAGITGSLAREETTDSEVGVRPVINLKSNTNFTFEKDENKGTFSNPYIVE